MFVFSNQAAANLADLIDYAYTLNSDRTPGTYPVCLPTPTPTGYTVEALAYATDNIIICDRTKYYGIVASSATEIVIAIRGTGDAVEWVLDFEFTLTPFPLGQSKVETGFYSILSSMQFVDLNGTPFDLAGYLVKALTANPNLSLIIEGHSLGGALVSMLAVQLSQNATLKKAMSVITLASPAPGDPAFASFYNQNVPATYRIWNPWDLVPHAPPSWLGFEQVAGAGQKLSPTTSELEEYDFFSPGCNHSLLTYQWLLDPSGHPLSSCKWPWEAEARIASMQAAVQRMKQRAQSK